MAFVSLIFKTLMTSPVIAGRILGFQLLFSQHRKTDASFVA